MTLSAPRASTARAPTSAESMPPESPTTAVGEPALPRVVADPEDERATERLERLALGVVGKVRRLRAGDRRDARPVEVDDDEVLLEERGAGPDAAASVEGHRPAVEDQLVVPADEVHVDHGDAPVASEPREHPSPQAGLPLGERRGRDVDDQVGPARQERLSRVVAIETALAEEVLVVPEVLADREADPPAAEPDEGRGLRGLEVAHLVEDVVGREEALPGNGGGPAVPQEDRRVEQGLSGLRGIREERPGQQGGPSRAARELAEKPGRLRLERGAVEEVAGRVAAKRHLGNEEEVGPCRLGLLPEGLDLRAVPREVADRGVHLAEGETHRADGNALSSPVQRAATRVVPERRSESVRPFRSKATTRRGTPASAPVSSAPRKRRDEAARVGDPPSAAETRRSASAIPGVAPQTNGTRTSRTSAARKRKAPRPRRAAGGKRSWRRIAPAASSRAPKRPRMTTSARPAANRRANATGTSAPGSSTTSSGSSKLRDGRGRGGVRRRLGGGAGRRRGGRERRLGDVGEEAHRLPTPPGRRSGISSQRMLGERIAALVRHRSSLTGGARRA